MAISDNFNRADGGLGGNWSTVGANAMAIVSNAAMPSGFGALCRGIYTGSAWGNDQSSQATASASPFDWRLLLRCDGTANNYYEFQSGGGVGGMNINRMVSGVPGTIATDATNISGTDVIKFEVVGTTLSVYKNSGFVFSTTDASLASGSPGISGSFNGGFDSFDDWVGTGESGGGGGGKPDAYYRMLRMYRREQRDREQRIAQAARETFLRAA